MSDELIPGVGECWKGSRQNRGKHRERKTTGKNSQKKEQ